MPTLQDAARALADAIGGFGLFCVTEAASPSDPDARRTLISDDLLDEDRDPTAFNDFSVYAAGGTLGGQQKAVRRDGYDGTNGRLYTAGQFSAPAAVGQEIEYHARLPRVRHFGEPGLREVTNEALHRLWFTDELLLTATSGTGYPAPAWLTANRQIVGIKTGGDPGVGVNPAWAPSTPTLLHDSGGTRIQLPCALAPGTLFRIVARRPHATWIKSGGRWADSTAGLVDDDDETMADPEALLVISVWRAYRALARRSPDFETGPWRAEEARAEQVASAFIQFGAGDTSSPLGAPGAVSSVWAKGGSPGNGWS